MTDLMHFVQKVYRNCTEIQTIVLQQTESKVQATSRNQQKKYGRQSVHIACCTPKKFITRRLEVQTKTLTKTDLTLK